MNWGSPQGKANWEKAQAEQQKRELAAARERAEQNRRMDEAIRGFYPSSKPKRSTADHGEHTYPAPKPKAKGSPTLGIVVLAVIAYFVFGGDSQERDAPSSKAEAPLQSERPAPVPDQGAALRMADSMANLVYSEAEVDVPAKFSDGTFLYPVELQATGDTGEVVAQFVVDTLGNPEAGNAQIVKSDNPAFSRATLDGLTSMRYTPAIFHGHAVKQMVYQAVHFSPPAPDTMSAPRGYVH